MNKNCNIDIHAIHAVPPCCANRDEAGSPKTAVYGGVRRARISSQCWKRAMRERFAVMEPECELGKRTKLLNKLVADAIRSRSPELDAEALAENALITAGISFEDDKKKKNDKKTKALFFVSQSQIEALADVVVQNVGKDLKKEECQAALNALHSFDVALFGRMVAMKDGENTLNCDAAAQVAHAISTHEVENECDYFTAIDDCASPDKVNAEHIGTTEFNSATFYRYATVNVNDLMEKLHERTSAAVREFVEAFILSMPKGKINSFANNALPSAVYVTIRHDQPINLVGAFEKPIYAGKDGYVEKSINALISHAKKVYNDYLGEPDAAFAIGEGMEKLAPKMSLRELLDNVEQYVKMYGGIS